MPDPKPDAGGGRFAPPPRDLAGPQGGRSRQDPDASQIRNEQRGGQGRPAERPDGPEPNETLREAWSEPGGEAYNYRNSLVGAGGKSDNHSDLTAAETPDTDRHLSDATLSPQDKDATAAAIARMGSAKPGQKCPPRWRASRPKRKRAPAGKSRAVRPRRATRAAPG